MFESFRLLESEVEEAANNDSCKGVAFFPPSLVTNLVRALAIQRLKEMVN